MAITITIKQRLEIRQDLTRRWAQGGQVRFPGDEQIIDTILFDEEKD